MTSILYIISYIAFVFLMTSFMPSLIPIWIIIAPIFSVIIIFLTFLILVPFYFAAGKQNRFFSYLTRNLGQTINRFIARLDLDTTGLEHIPRTGPTVFYVTHKSYTDFSILMSLIPRSVAFTPKSGVYKLPIISLWLKAMGCFKINRENNRETARGMIHAIQNLKEGHSLVVFPEGGTHHRDSDLMTESKAGAFKLAIKSEATVVPVKIFGKEQVRTRFPFFPTTKRVVFLKSMPYESFKHLTTQALAELVMENINSVK